MLKKERFLIAVLLVVGCVSPALAVEFQFHGDMNNRFLLYTNRSDWLSPEQQGKINEENVDATYGELKYRFWFEAADDNDMIKGVYAIEIGGIRFGRTGSLGKGVGGSYSGDAANIETRWAYFDFQTPGVDRKLRWRMGLQPYDINEYLWKETATGLLLTGAPTDTFDFQASWIRTVDKLARDPDQDNFKDVDNFYGRINFNPMEDLQVGLLGLYVNGGNNANSPDDFGEITGRGYLLKAFADDATLGYYNLGIDGSWKPGKYFVNWDLIYQGGKIKDVTYDDTEFSGVTKSGDFDMSGWFGHFDAGVNLGKHKLTYTFWYASGDDNPNDDKFKGYLAIDLDRDDSLSMFEGAYTDDVTYFTERPYLLDKGMIMNKIGWEYDWTEKLKVGAAGMYMMTAEDIEYTDYNDQRQKNSAIGFEINGFFKYMLFKNVEFAVNVGYLFAGDALDAFEVGAMRDGSSDENIFVSSSRIRYTF